MGGRVGERAGVASKIALPRFPKRTPDTPSCKGVQGVLLPGPPGGRWNPLLLPGAVQPRFCRSNLDREVLGRSEEHTSELQSLMRISYAVFCLKKKNNNISYCLQPKDNTSHIR